MFFFDYGDFKIFGSSPEAQLIVKEGKAEIHPIAGTFKRTGNEAEDHILAERLAADPKENSEHMMLVDLARNDLSRNGNGVVVEKNREIQFFSHVIHLVSKVTAFLKPMAKTFQVVADTFPAGTLSGAPKHMSIKLIDRYENTARDVYGGHWDIWILGETLITASSSAPLLAKPKALLPSWGGHCFEICA